MTPRTRRTIDRIVIFVYGLLVGWVLIEAILLTLQIMGVA